MKSERLGRLLMNNFRPPGSLPGQSSSNLVPKEQEGWKPMEVNSLSQFSRKPVTHSKSVPCFLCSYYFLSLKEVIYLVEHFYPSLNCQYTCYLSLNFYFIFIQAFLFCIQHTLILPLGYSSSTALFLSQTKHTTFLLLPWRDYSVL